MLTYRRYLVPCSQSPDMFVRFQRFNLNIPGGGQVARLPVACLMVRTKPLETVAELGSQSAVGLGVLEASDSSEDEQPKSTRRKGKKGEEVTNQPTPAQLITNNANTALLAIKP